MKKVMNIVSNPPFVLGNGEVVIANPPYQGALRGSEPYKVIVANPPYTVGDSLKSLFK
jgi:methylase of polypeptide subunit release factors